MVMAPRHPDSRQRALTLHCARPRQHRQALPFSSLRTVSQNGHRLRPRHLRYHLQGGGTSICRHLRGGESVPILRHRPQLFLQGGRRRRENGGARRGDSARPSRGSLRSCRLPSPSGYSPPPSDRPPRFGHVPPAPEEQDCGTGCYEIPLPAVPPGRTRASSPPPPGRPPHPARAAAPPGCAPAAIPKALGDNIPAFP